MVVEVIDGRLFIDGREVVLPFPVEQYIVLGDRVIVRIDNGHLQGWTEDEARNVLAISSSGEILWKVRPFSRTREKEGEFFSFPYSNLWQEEASGRVLVYNPGGFEFDVDPETGELSNSIWVR